jgi:small GTP-binding protein
MLVSWNGRENNIKVVMLGESGVGKSSLATRFVSSAYIPHGEMTVGANYLSKSVNIRLPWNVEDADGASIHHDMCETHQHRRKSCLKNAKSNCPHCCLQQENGSVAFKIWDTAGQEKFHSLVPMYYRGAGAAVLVFDLTKPESLRSLSRWVDELRERGPAGILFALCGNKSDLTMDRRVDKEAAEAFADEIGAFYIEASAQEGVNVDEIFLELARRVAAVERDAVSQSMSHCSCADNGLMLGTLEDVLLSIHAGSKRTCC